MNNSTWHFITGEYPPQPGGVSDYTQHLAKELSAAGDDVHIWTSSRQESITLGVGATVHRLNDCFGLRGLTSLSEELAHYPYRRRLLVQYVPHAYGWKALNLPFCLWLLSRRRAGDSVWVMFHEVAFPLSRAQSVRHNILGLGTRAMAWFIMQAAERVFVSIPAWDDLLKTFAPSRPTTWLPIPSNIPVVDDRTAVAATRQRYAAKARQLVGHFGTYGQHIAETLKNVTPKLLSTYDEASVLLMGRKGEHLRRDLISLYPNFEPRIHATGYLTSSELSLHLSACDVMLQPYPDGVSSRRTSVMACLEHCVACVTTDGFLTEKLWSERNAVVLVPVAESDGLVEAVGNLLKNVGERRRVSDAGARLYRERFDLKNTIAVLRDESNRCLEMGTKVCESPS